MADRFLARFRVDPARVRVAVRRAGAAWLVIVAARQDGPRVQARSGVDLPAKALREAIHKALLNAERAGIPGIDRHMERAYDHPHGALAPLERVSRIAEKESTST